MKKWLSINNVLKWTACVITLSAAILTSLKFDPWNVYLFNIGAFLYLAWSIRIREWNLVVINGGLLAIYGFGLTLRILE